MRKLLENYHSVEGMNGSKLNDQKIRVLQTIGKRRVALTIPEISRELKITAPTCIKLLNQLIEDGLVLELGKRDTASGRKPVLYDLNDSAIRVISVEISMKRISFAVLDRKLNIIFIRNKADFGLENNQKSLDHVIGFVQKCLEKSGLKHDDILGMGVGISGRVSRSIGESFTFMNFMDKPLASHLSEVFKMVVFVDNETRCFGMAEKISGKAAQFRHSVVINLSRGLGASLIANNALVEGGAGFAGGFGHMQWGQSEKVCRCGKLGCLATEVSGNSLEEQFIERIAQGGKSMVLQNNSVDQVRYDQILEAALTGDALAVELVSQMGLNLGKALGNIVNLLNPEAIIIGGKFSKARSVLHEPVKKGIESTALVNLMKYCTLDFSEIGEQAGLKGAGAMVLQHFEFI